MQQTSDLDSTILGFLWQLKGCVARLAGHYCPSQNCGCSSVGRAPPCQGGRRQSEPGHPRQPSLGAERRSKCWSERAVALASAGRPKAQGTAGRPALLMFYVYLLKSREGTAIPFEKYPKSGSGRAFINRHFV